MAGMVLLELLGVTEGNNHHMVLLRHEDRVLPIVVGLAEAHAIQMGLMNQKIGRPMTHDLVSNILAGLRSKVQSVMIYKLENETFFAHLSVEQCSAEGAVEQVLRIDSRPSDGIAIAVREKCPIYAAEEVMAMAGQDVSILGDEYDDGNENDIDDPGF